MPPREITAVDIDEVLFPLIDYYLAFYNRNNGTNYKREDVWTYDLERVFRKTKEEVLSDLDLFYQSADFLKMPLIPGAKAGLKILRRKSDLVGITARPDHTKNHTIYSLECNFPAAISRTYFTGEMNRRKNGNERTKAEICADIKATRILEDSLRNALECAALGMEVYLFECPWNIRDRPKTFPENVRIVKSWQKAMSFF